MGACLIASEVLASGPLPAFPVTFLLPIPARLHTGSYLQRMCQTLGLMEPGLRKWLPPSSPNKTVPSFPRHPQSVMCLCVCQSETSQELFLGADLRVCWEFTRGNKKEDQQGCPGR